MSMTTVMNNRRNYRVVCHDDRKDKMYASKWLYRRTARKLFGMIKKNSDIGMEKGDSVILYQYKEGTMYILDMFMKGEEL